ncbi:MAG: PLP-dependent aminotransferase family protein, partial [Hyphomicrobiales bacterium]
AQWARLLQKHARNPPVDFMTEQDPAGEWALREAIADHLRVWRGLSCGAEQIFVTSGGVDAADLVLRCVAVPGGKAFLEDPGYGGTRRVVQEFGLNVDFRPVDEEGMMLPVEASTGLEGAVALVTPSRQFPLGLTKSLSRRLALIDWATRHKAWIMEDDYDSEFRYAGRPLAAMMSLDETGRVIYVGSFSNTMFKGLRLGFAVVPPRLVERMQEVLSERGTNASTIAQLALAEFMSSGQFATHARRLRRLYGRRRAVLREELIARCGDFLEVENTPSGMNLLVNLKDDVFSDQSDVDLSARLKEAGISVSPLSKHYVKFEPRQGFVLGYAGFEEEAIRAGVKKLSAVLREVD